jgi:hypothetical protein
MGCQFFTILQNFKKDIFLKMQGDGSFLVTKLRWSCNDTCKAVVFIHVAKTLFASVIGVMMQLRTIGTIRTPCRLATANFLNYAKYQVLTVVLMKIQILWNVTQCRLVNSYQRFGDAWCLHLQGKEVRDFGDNLLCLVLSYHTN